MLKDEKILKKLNKVISNIFNCNIGSYQFLGEGYISKVYKIKLNNGKLLAIKILKNNKIWGFEYPLEAIKSLVISDLMIKNSQSINGLKTYGVHEIDGIRFQIMNFIEGKKMKIENFYDDSIINKIAQKLANIHIYGKQIVKNFKDDLKERYWKRSFREVFSNTETLLSIYEIWYTKSEYEDLGWNLFNLILEKYRKYIKYNRKDRLTILHGDCWYDNVIIGNEDIYFIDFSRIPYGDPAVDVGRFIGEYVLRYGLFDDKRYDKVVNTFLKNYISITKDKEILKFLDISILWVFYIDASPLVQHFLNWDEKIFDKLKNIINNFNDFKDSVINIV